MNQERANQLSASLFRQLFLLKMLDYEYQFFIKFPLPSGIKNIMYRGKVVYTSLITDLKAHLTKSSHVIDKTVTHSDEKIMAISNILERLALLDEADVLALEDEFTKQVKVKY